MLNDSISRVSLAISFFLNVTVVLALALSIFFANWTMLFASVLTLLTFQLPSILQKRLRVTLPIEFELMLTMFLYASLLLGEGRDFYERFWWWDAALHTVSGVILGFIGFLILYTLQRQRRLEMKPFLLVFFSFCFAMALGAMWEIFEFGMDQIFGLNMQKSGLVDTMWDLMVDAAGALLVSVLGYFYIKHRKSPVGFFDELLMRFATSNPKLWRRRRGKKKRRKKGDRGKSLE